MTREIVDLNDFTILIEEANATEPTVDTCLFEEPVIGIAFYGSGNVELDITDPYSKKTFSYTKGMVLSFYADDKVAFTHKVSATKPLACVVIVTAIQHLQKLPNQEGEIFSQLLNQLVHPTGHYVEGPVFHMTPEMLQAVDQVFTFQYEGKTKMMFLRSQATALLSHFFGQLSLSKRETINQTEREKLLTAQELLLKNLDAPPSLNELSRQIGLNSFKLKKDFKALFGVPVFKYLQNERLTKAHKLLQTGNVTIQEAAWQVGYDSLSSFSNAFNEKYGFRPSSVRPS
ncbi:MAG: AraC family transcriptional regulator [Bacteroidota bacterium]